MADWGALLERLAEAPRENGTPAIHETARFLVDALGAAGANVSTFAFEAHPYGLRLAGVLGLAGAMLYWRLMRERRFRSALAVAFAVPALLLAELDFGVPVFGWLGAQTQHHVIGRIAAPEPERRIIFAAHYDSKTDLLDHVERAPIELLGLPVTALMLAGALAGLLGAKRLARLVPIAMWTAPVYGLALFASMSAGAFVPSRSPGALDDGASCAVLVKLAERLAAAPPARSEVELLLLSAEEVGVQGSAVYARERFAEPPDLPTWVVNLEGLGEAADFAVLGRETFSLRAYPADPDLVSLLDEIHRARREEPLYVTPYGGATDARSFLAQGIPAATLTSDLPGHAFTRDLHSSADSRDRVDPGALDEALELLVQVAQRFDESAPEVR